MEQQASISLRECKGKNGPACVSLSEHCGRPVFVTDEHCAKFCEIKFGKLAVKKCCGKIGHIAKGFGKWAWEELSGGQPEAFVVERAEKCLACEKRTLLHIAEWSARLGYDFLKTKLLRIDAAELPIDHEPGPYKIACCAICKCCLSAKIRVRAEGCSLGKWGPVAEASETIGGGSAGV